MISSSSVLHNYTLSEDHKENMARTRTREQYNQKAPRRANVACTIVVVLVPLQTSRRLFQHSAFLSVVLLRLTSSIIPPSHPIVIFSALLLHKKGLIPADR